MWDQHLHLKNKKHANKPKPNTPTNHNKVTKQTRKKKNNNKDHHRQNLISPRQKHRLSPPRQLRAWFEDTKGVKGATAVPAPGAVPPTRHSSIVSPPAPGVLSPQPPAAVGVPRSRSHPTAWCPQSSAQPAPSLVRDLPAITTPQPAGAKGLGTDAAD